MDTTEISNYQDLTDLILQARESKDEQDLELLKNFEEFVKAVSPIQIVKSTLHEFVKDKGVQFDLIKGGMNLGADYLIENIVNKDNTVKGFFKSVILENISSAFIHKNAPQIVIGATKLFSFISNRMKGVKENTEEEEDDVETSDLG